MTYISPTEITADSPPGGGVVDVQVTSDGGPSATTPADQFTFVGLPTVSGITPTEGPEAGGTTVTITGTGFAANSTVSFGPNQASSVNFLSATQITAVSPAGTGTVDVQVSTTGGTSDQVGADQFTYVPAPTVTGIAPTQGPTSGGTTVDITGTGFTPTSTVSFGGTAGTNFVYVSPTEVTAVSPAGIGTVDVTVTAVGGSTTTSPADQFTYLAPPTVTGITPKYGPKAGGTTVTITGTGFTPTSTVSFGGTAGTSVTYISPTQITAVSPAGTGTVDVQVTTLGVESAASSSDLFTYVVAPVVSSISPMQGPTAGGTKVTITGTGFTPTSTVSFGGTAGTNFVYVSPTEVTAVSPAGTGTVDVQVTSIGGESAAGTADQFNYMAPPAISGITPVEGPVAGGTTVTITGTGFIAGSTVTFGDTPATNVVVHSPTSITAVSPLGAGTVNVTVTTAGGTSATNAGDQFTYIPKPIPTVGGVSPATGPSIGGNTVTITGTNFTGATSVSFGTTSTTKFTVVSATEITVTVPAGTGTVTVSVTTSNGTGSKAGGYTYLAAPILHVTNVAPAEVNPGSTYTDTVSPSLGAGGSAHAAPTVSINLAATTSFSTAPSGTHWSCSLNGAKTVATCHYTGTLPIAASSALPVLTSTVSVSSSAKNTLTTTVTLSDPSETHTSATSTSVISVNTVTPIKHVVGYWTVATDGGIFAFGQARFYGSMGGKPLNKPVVGMAPTGDGNGYWMDATDGGIFAFGDAKFYGSMGSQHLNQPVVGMAPTPDGKGYWLVASDGGMFSFGDAKFYGSMGGQPLNSPIVGMAATADGKGYWLVASDGGIFAFGDAHFYGSMGGKHLDKPIVGIAASAGTGYWLDASDGGVFAFGTARFYGSMGGKPLNKPMVGMSSTPDGGGYWTDASDGGIFTYGDAHFYGSMGGMPLNKPMVGMATYAK